MLKISNFGKSIGNDLKSSAPVELSFFDEKETLKHVISKKKFNF